MSTLTWQELLLEGYPARNDIVTNLLKRCQEQNIDPPVEIAQLHQLKLQQEKIQHQISELHAKGETSDEDLITMSKSIEALEERMDLLALTTADLESNAWPHPSTASSSPTIFRQFLTTDKNWLSVEAMLVIVEAVAKLDPKLHVYLLNFVEGTIHGVWYPKGHIERLDSWHKKEISDQDFDKWLLDGIERGDTAFLATNHIPGHFQALLLDTRRTFPFSSSSLFERLTAVSFQISPRL